MTLFTKCDFASEIWQQLDLASELESDLQAGTEFSLLISMLENFNLFCLTGVITMVFKG